ncbi:hypothetical protein PUN28_012576 [Cardiocondyla obscurior]|uniref:Uncharacterized protein n=1 Tax=Cardiocondyla obscurior TaxID=286306 RepID=A0AAW2FEP8_9HYME
MRYRSCNRDHVKKLNRDVINITQASAGFERESLKQYDGSPGDLIVGRSFETRTLRSPVKWKKKKLSSCDDGDAIRINKRPR